MKRPADCRVPGLLCTLALVSAVTAAPQQLPPIPTNAVVPLAPAVARPFDLADVTPGPAPVHDAMERDRAYLLRSSSTRCS